MLNRRSVAALICMAAFMLTMSVNNGFANSNHFKAQNHPNRSHKSFRYKKTRPHFIPKPMKETYTIVAIPATQFYSEEDNLVPVLQIR